MLPTSARCAAVMPPLAVRSGGTLVALLPTVSDFVVRPPLADLAGGVLVALPEKPTCAATIPPLAIGWWISVPEKAT